MQMKKKTIQASLTIVLAFVYPTIWFSIQLPILPSFAILVWIICCLFRFAIPLKIKTGKQIHQCNICKQFSTKVAFCSMLHRDKLYIAFRLYIELSEISTNSQNEWKKNRNARNFAALHTVHIASINIS